MPVHVGTVQLDRDLNDKVLVTTDCVLVFLGHFSAPCRMFSPEVFPEVKAPC